MNQTLRDLDKWIDGQNPFVVYGVMALFGAGVYLAAKRFIKTRRQRRVAERVCLAVVVAFFVVDWFWAPSRLLWLANVVGTCALLFGVWFFGRRDDAEEPSEKP